jgi:hypothetical protein
MSPSLVPAAIHRPPGQISMHVMGSLLTFRRVDSFP